MNVYTQPSEENCPDCIELVDTDCIVYDQSFTSTGLGAGKTLTQILKSINAKLLKFSSWFKKLIYNFTPVFESGIPIATYTDGSCTTPTVNLNIPLFLNGKYCFEFPVDEDTTGYFSVLSVMGSYVFYDEDGIEVTDPLIIATYEELFTEGLVVPTCCTDCGGGNPPVNAAEVLSRTFELTATDLTTNLPMMLQLEISGDCIITSVIFDFKLNGGLGIDYGRFGIISLANSYYFTGSSLSAYQLLETSNPITISNGYQLTIDTYLTIDPLTTLDITIYYIIK